MTRAGRFLHDGGSAEVRRATLNGKNLPDPLYSKLRARARRQRRSIAQEVTLILLEAVERGSWDWSTIWPPGRSSLDTAAFIYMIEEHPRFLKVVEPLFQAVDAGRIRFGLLRAAAQLRASVAVRTPDALQLAVALATNCATFVADDRRLPPVSGLRVLEIADYAA